MAFALIRRSAISLLIIVTYLVTLILAPFPVCIHTYAYNGHGIDRALLGDVGLQACLLVSLALAHPQSGDYASTKKLAFHLRPLEPIR